MHIVDWTSPPAYEAISYAWGDVGDTTSSFCDGHLVLITHNLKDALATMRRRDRPRFLWADAVCIDQSCKEEREHQVSHMLVIYEKATRVLVWLGKDVDGQAVKAAAALEEIAGECIRLGGGKEKAHRSTLKYVDELWDVLPQGSLKGPRWTNPNSWKALAWLFSRPWFDRLWVIQEVNSNIEVDILCGGVQTSWDVVALVASYIQRHPKIHLYWGFPDSYHRNAYYMRRRLWFREVTLPSLLNWGRSFSATEPLDRVYALMGMPSFAKMANPFKVDYSISTVDLGKKVAARCIQEMQSLRVLCYAQHIEEKDTVPSWVPRWDCTEQYNPINDTLKKVRWRASGDTKPSVDFEDGVLKLTGVVFDEIKSYRPLGNATWLENNDLENHPILEFLATDNAGSVYPTGGKSLDAVALSLTAGLGANLRKASENITSFRANFAAYSSRLLYLANLYISSSLKTQAEFGDWFEYESLVAKKGRNRSLFYTRTGYIGLGPPGCRVGDLVCLLFGGEVPFILRPRAESYQLVGDGYVHGIMEGEAVSTYATERAKIVFRVV